MVYETQRNGGEGLEPSFAHARDVAQITQAVRIVQDKNTVDVSVLEDSLEKHVLIVLQRMNIDIALIANKTRTFRIQTNSLDQAFHALDDFCPLKISSESDSVMIDVDDNITPVEIAEYLKERNIHVQKVEIIAESEKELRRTILENH